jgi:hypothetical protein
VVRWSLLVQPVAWAHSVRRVRSNGLGLAIGPRPTGLDEPAGDAQVAAGGDPGLADSVAPGVASQDPGDGDAAAVQRDFVAARGELLAEQIAERQLGDLGLLQSDDVGPALVEPRQAPGDALLDRVDVPGCDSRAANRTWPVSPAILS